MQGSAAAFGAFARLSPASAHLVDGIEHADSLAFDLHKWLYVQYDCGCVLVKSADTHRNTFSVIPSYLRKFDRGLASGPVSLSEYGVQLSRSFKALRAWTALKTEGTDRYGQQIEQNIQQARYLTRLTEGRDELELLAPTAMNIVNFRQESPSVITAADAGISRRWWMPWSILAMRFADSSKGMPQWCRTPFRHENRGMLIPYTLPLWALLYRN